MLECLWESRTFMFGGPEIKPPSPDTYDTKNFVFPTRKLFRVEIWKDGSWVVELNGARIKSGDEGEWSRKCARQILEKHCSLYFS
jgi:hypothetical protein